MWTGPCSNSRAAFSAKYCVELARVVQDLLQPARLLGRHARLLLVARASLPGAGLAAERPRASLPGAAGGGAQQARDAVALAVASAGLGGDDAGAQRHGGDGPAREGEAAVRPPHRFARPRAVAPRRQRQHQRQRVERVGEQAEPAEGAYGDELDAEAAPRPPPARASAPAGRAPRRRRARLRARPAAPAGAGRQGAVEDEADAAERHAPHLAIAALRHRVAPALGARAAELAHGGRAALSP